MRILSHMILLSVMLAVITGCGHESLSERVVVDLPTDTGSGQRPGVSDANDYSHELDDDVLRLTGPDISLRYDRGGVLFIRRQDGSVVIHDLDGADELTVCTGIEGADSVMSGASLILNGRTVNLPALRMLRHAADRTWYVSDRDSGDIWFMVLP